MRRSNGRGPEISPWSAGDLVRVPSGKVGRILEFGQRVDLDGAREPRAIVAIFCSIVATDYLSIRGLYHPADLIPAELDPSSTEAAIMRLRALPDRRA